MSYYIMKSRIRYSEVDNDMTLTIPAMINYFQDCSTFHTEDSGHGLAFTAPRQEGWFIFSWQIDIDRLPKLGENILVKTWPSKYMAVFVNRDFQMETEDGEVLIRVRSIWALMDLEKLLPSKATWPEEVFPVEEEPVAGKWGGRKIREPKELALKSQFTVRFDQLDSNHHMNNQHYIEEAMICVPEGRRVVGIRTEYKLQAVLDDVVYIYEDASDENVERTEDSEQTITTVLKKEDGSTYATVQFITEVDA